MDTQTYLFIFGRTPELAYRELTALFPHTERINESVARVSGDAIDVHKSILALGGTTKIALFTGEIPALTPLALLTLLDAHSGSVEFGLSFYHCLQIPKNLDVEMKKMLEESGIKVRYVRAEHDNVLSTVVVDKTHLTELVIVQKGETYLIGKTVAVQPYEQWNTRDYGRPCADAHSGMLPPKVARMIVNLAGTEAHTLLDPFCGMGTVLAEGYMRGLTVIGSDVSQDVIGKAKKNLAWLEKTFPGTGGRVADIQLCDAVHISGMQKPASVDTIVTEPYMGPTAIVNTQDSVKVKNTIKGLEKLYIGCLRDWHTVLVPHGTVIIALPEYAVSGRTYFVKKVVDMCENLGYTIEDGPIAYSRPQAIVRRLFYKFRKTT